jgi:hypothetical protein
MNYEVGLGNFNANLLWLCFSDIMCSQNYSSFKSAIQAMSSGQNGFSFDILLFKNIL